MKKETKPNSHLEVLKASNNQLPFLTRIGIGSLWEWSKHVIIYESKDANKSAKYHSDIYISFCQVIQRQAFTEQFTYALDRSNPFPQQ